MILDYIFASNKTCCLCKEEEAEKFGLCPDCYKKLDRIDFSDYVEDIGMRLTYPLFYNNYMSKLLANFKFNGQTHLYKSFGDIMYEAALGKGIFDRVDMIVPVPLHPRKFRERGYNQSQLLAKRIAERAGIDLREDLLKKTIYTKEQNTLTSKERMKNLHNTIRVHKDFYKCRVLIIDDVYTTGATIRSITGAMDQKADYIETLVLTSGQRIEY